MPERASPQEASPIRVGKSIIFGHPVVVIAYQRGLEAKGGDRSGDCE